MTRLRGDPTAITAPIADRLKVRSRAFFEELGFVAQAVGREEFYERLVQLPARVVGCDGWLVVRYAHYAVPEFVVNNAMSEDAANFYFDGLYRLDPLLRLARSGQGIGVHVLSRLRGQEGDNAYFDDIFRSAMILDELAILLPAPGRVAIALCLDRSRRRFTDREIERVEMIYPALESLNHSHLDHVLTSASSNAVDVFGADSRQGVLILDRENRRICNNALWDRIEAGHATPLTDMVHRNRDEGAVSLDHETVLHWERLSGSFAIAPHGKICVIERRGPGYRADGFHDILSRFAARHTLTPRERDIVALVLRGYSNAFIAKELEISAGTVRNHRTRLYYKLDVTTERELFSLFLDEISRTFEETPVGAATGSAAPSDSGSGVL